MFIMELNLPTFKDYDLSSLRLVSVSGAATPVSITSLGSCSCGSVPTIISRYIFRCRLPGLRPTKKSGPAGPLLILGSSPQPELLSPK